MSPKVTRTNVTEPGLFRPSRTYILGDVEPLIDARLVDALNLLVHGTLLLNRAVHLRSDDPITPETRNARRASRS